MRLSRTCYDKPHRCPGWAGGGWRFPKTDLCENGSIRVNVVDDPDAATGWAGLAYPGSHPWRFGRCNKCDVITLPHAFRRLDPGYWRHSVAVSRLREMLRSMVGR